METKCLRVGVIGVGGMGKGHCKGLSQVEDVKLTAVADINPTTAAAVGNQYQVPYFPDHQALIRAGLCEAVMVSTPHPEHYQPAVDCLQAGLHVFCEKPLTEMVSTARRMIQCAQKHKRVLAVDFPLRFSPIYQAALEIVRAGRLGQLARALLVMPHFRTQAYYDSGSWRATWKGEGGGFLLNQAPHQIDAFLQMTGMPSAVFGIANTRWHKIEVEDTAEALLRFPNGATGYLYGSTGDTVPGDLIELGGDKGKLTLRNGNLDLQIYEHSLTDCIHSQTGMWDRPKAKAEPVTIKPPEHKGSLVWRNFVRHILYQEPLLLQGASGLASLELANAIMLSSARGRWLNLPLNARAYDRFLAAKRA